MIALCNDKSLDEADELLNKEAFMAVKHTWRTKDGTKTGKLTPLKAIYAKCFDCSG